MNKIRRKNIDAIQERLEELRSDVELILDEEQEAFDNLPESLQEAERGQAMQDSIDYLEEAISSIDEAIGNLETAKGE